MKKKKKIITLLLCGLVPALIFIIMAYINQYIPFGDYMFNIYDADGEYPGILLEYARLIKTGNIFYSWAGGLGFNFYAIVTYYGFSPLNLLVLFANYTNYEYFIAYMTYFRFFLLGLSMGFYLIHKNIKPTYIVLLSSCYSLMGISSCYYYNFCWIDSMMMLPIVIYGLDKIFENKSPALYLGTLAFTIIINYYIGYMICIFCLIYFIYRILLDNKNKKKHIIDFTVSSLLAGLISTVIILPNIFAIFTGKSGTFTLEGFGGIQESLWSFFYNLTTGTYWYGEHAYGPALVYSGLITIILSIFFFLSKKYTKKEKIVTGAILLFFYLSFSINAINYTWHLFQMPVWWQSRFSFTFSFFFILIAVKGLEGLDQVNLTVKKKIIISLIMIIVVIGSLLLKQNLSELSTLTKSLKRVSLILSVFSLLILISELMFTKNKKYVSLIFILTVLDLGINCYTNLANNAVLTTYDSTVENLALIDDDSLYRSETVNNFSNNGLYYGFNGIDYLNSARNQKVINLIGNFGQAIYGGQFTYLVYSNPLFLSLFNIKYINIASNEYYTEIDEETYVNPYPLSIGFIVNDQIKDTEINDVVAETEDLTLFNGTYADIISNKTYENLNIIVNAMTNSDLELYTLINYEEMKIEDNVVSYKFKCDKDYIVALLGAFSQIIVNGEEKEIVYNMVFSKGDVVELKGILNDDVENEDMFIQLLDKNEYESAMETLSENMLDASIHTNGHIIEGTINVTGENTYLFTSIEYEEGMTVYVDGEEVEPDLLFGILIGLDLTEGEHTIYIDYVPKGFKAGLVISISVLILAIVYVITRRKLLKD